MIGRLSFPHLKDAMGTKIDAEPALNADHGLVDLVVPVDGADNAGIDAAAASDAFFFRKADPGFFSPDKGVHGAGSDTGGIIADPAGYHGEPVFHPAAGPDPYTRLRQAMAVRSSRAGEHAALATDTPLRVNYRQYFHLKAPHCKRLPYSIRTK
jgi:hypothetical protein